MKKQMKKEDKTGKTDVLMIQKISAKSLQVDSSIHFATAQMNILKNTQ